MRPNRTREKLASGMPVFGSFLRYPDAGVAELLALQGLDFIVFDGEHGTLAPQTCEQMTRAAELHGVTPGARVEENRAASILRYLDAGALICHVPGVDSARDALRAVEAVKFQPLGKRGLSASRASGFGARDGYPAYMRRANAETQLVVHVETAAGVAAAAEIAEIEGVDVLLFGALDLSHDLGCPGELDDPELLAAADEVAAAAKAAGKVFGAVVGSPAAAGAWRQRGARYLMTTIESFVSAGVAPFRAEAGV
jgi:4-hydroxy-2-oxoheptanedioate aldolase